MVSFIDLIDSLLKNNLDMCSKTNSFISLKKEEEKNTD
jgi:hypothetical protein